MFNALYVYGFVAFAACWWFVWSLGGPTARLVITAGLYYFSPHYHVTSYMRPAVARALNRSLRGHPDHRQRRVSSDALVAEFVPVGSNATTVVLDPTASVLVRAEMADDGSDVGAEHWGDLLRQMNTEERVIYDMERYLDHEAHMGVERKFLSGLDEAVAAVIAHINAENEAADAREAFWRRSAERRGTDWETATQAWELVPA